MVNIFHRKLAFWVPVAPEPLFLVSSRIFSSTNKLRASHQSTWVTTSSFYTVPQRSRRIHVVSVTCTSASEWYYIPPPPAHQPTLHVWDMSKSRAAEKPWRPDRANKHGIWRQHAQDSNSPRRPKGVVSTNKLTMHTHVHINRLGMILLSNDHWSIKLQLLLRSIAQFNTWHPSTTLCTSKNNKNQLALGACFAICWVLTAAAVDSLVVSAHMLNTVDKVLAFFCKKVPQKTCKEYLINPEGFQLVCIQPKRFESCLHHL